MEWIIKCNVLGILFYTYVTKITASRVRAKTIMLISILYKLHLVITNDSHIMSMHSCYLCADTWIGTGRHK